jgi:peroxiredoxin
MRSLFMPLLHPGGPFPELSLTVPGGATVKVPETFDGQFGAMLFYRGSWCPYCNAQLRAFQRASAALADAGVQSLPCRSTTKPPPPASSPGTA